MENPSSVDVIVVGAGISGLTVAARAQARGRSFALLEPGSKAGGVIRTEAKDGFLLEWGPNTVMATPELFELMRLVGLDEEALIADARTPRFILRRGRLEAVPMSPPALLGTPLLSPFGRLRLLMEPLIPRGKNPDESLARFARRRLGRQAAENLLAPFVSGVWAGDIEKLHAASAFPRLAEWERVHGSLLKGAIRSAKERRHGDTPRGLVSFRGGLEELPRRLAAHFGDALRLNTAVRRITRLPSNRWLVESDGGAWSAPALFIAAPSGEAARLVGGLDADAADALNETPYAPIAVLQMTAPRPAVKHDLNGFGYLTRPKDDTFILGCLWSSSLFPGRAPDGWVLLTVFVGGARHPERVALDDRELAEGAAKELRATLGISVELRTVALRRHERAIPQYNEGHAARVRRVRAAQARLPGLKFAGNYLEGISVGDVVKHAANAAG